VGKGGGTLAGRLESFRACGESLRRGLPALFWGVNGKKGKRLLEDQREAPSSLKPFKGDRVPEPKREGARRGWDLDLRAGKGNKKNVATIMTRWRLWKRASQGVGRVKTKGVWNFRKCSPHEKGIQGAVPLVAWGRRGGTG